MKLSKKSAEHQELLDIIEFLPDPTFVIDREGRVIAWNRSMEELSGAKKQAMIGKGEYLYAVPFYGESRPLLIDLVNLAAPLVEHRYQWFQRKGKTLFGEVFVPCVYNRKGAYLWGTASALFDQYGRPAGAIESMRDVTERKQLENALRESRERYRRIVETASDGIWLVDQDYRTIFVNQKMADILGYSVNEMIGEPFPTFLDAESWRQEEAWWLQSRQAGQGQHDCRLRHRNGTDVWTIGSVSPFFDQAGRLAGLLALFTDITDRKRRETAKLREREQAVKNYALALEAERSQRQRELSWLKDIVAKFSGVHAVEVHSAAMRHVFRQARQYHHDRAMPVLIQGETGTGKEVVAKVIHFSNMDTITPFVDINCAALMPTLFENELFGYEAGAFTGALTKGKSGKLDLAYGGTLFLDEVAEIPLELQGKLLRVIQEKEYYRVGGLKKIKTDVRIICATNVDLEEQVAKGLFRKDLYYRLKVGHLVVPALRQRREDILPLATTFLREFSRQKGKHFETIGKAAGRLLLDHHWPGNVRELRNVMEWVVFMYDDRELQPEHLELLEESGPVGTVLTRPNLLDPENFSLPGGEFPLEDFLDRLVRQALAMHRGNKAETARYLNISRSSLYCRLRRSRED